MTPPESVTAPTATDAGTPGPLNPDAGRASDASTGDASVSAPDAGRSGDASTTDAGTSDASRAPDASSRFHHLEISAAARPMIGDNFQLEASATYRPARIFGLGLSFITTPASRFGGAAHARLRADITPNIAFEPSLYLGLFGLNNLERDTGRLAERVQLNGLTFFAMVDLRIAIRPIDGFMFSLGPSLMMEVPVDVRSNPAMLASGENPNGGVRFVPGGVLSLSWEAIPNTPLPPPEDDAARRRREAPPAEPPADATAEQRIEHRVEAALAQIEERRREEARRRIDGIVQNFRDRQRSLESGLDHLTDGISATNQIASRLDEVESRLSERRRATLSAEDRTLVQEHLRSLMGATELNGEHQPVSSSDAHEDIRYGLRYIYSTRTAHRAYGHRMHLLLQRLARTLRSHHEDSLAGEVDQASTRLESYLNHHTGEHREGHFETGVIQMSDFQTEITALGQAATQVQTLAGEFGQTVSDDSTNPWNRLRGELNRTQERVEEMRRYGQALGDFAFIFQGETNDFGARVRDPAFALSTMEAALRFLSALPGSENYRGVTLSGLRERHRDYFNVLGHNLETFYRLHTPPVMVERRALAQWHESVVRARELLCQVNPGSAICAEALEGLPSAGAAGGRSSEGRRGRGRGDASRGDSGARGGSGASSASPGAGTAGTGTSGASGSGTGTGGPVRVDPPPSEPRASGGGSGTSTGRDAGTSSSGSGTGSGSGSPRGDAGAAAPPPPPPLPADTSGP